MAALCLVLAACKGGGGEPEGKSAPPKADAPPKAEPSVAQDAKADANPSVAAETKAAAKPEVRGDSGGLPANPVGEADGAHATAADTGEESETAGSDEEVGHRDTLGSLRTGMKASELVASLGPPKSKGKVELEGATGEYVATWTYPAHGLEVGMSSGAPRGPQTVNWLLAEAPCALATSRGIAIGSDKAAVEAAYAKEINAEDSDTDSIVVGSVYGGLILTIEGGKVARMFIGAAAE